MRCPAGIVCSPLVLGPVFSLTVLGGWIALKGMPAPGTLAAFGLLLGGWMVSEVLHLKRAQEEARERPNEDATSEQIARAQILLAESLSALRECFIALTASGAPADRDAVMARAMIALQSEDTVSQLLSHAQLRAQRLEQAAQALDNLTQELVFDVPSGLRDAQQQARIEARLTEAEQTLAELGSLRQPVRQRAVASGPVQLF